MKKMLLGILLLSAVVIVAAEEGESKLKWNELEVQTMNFEKKVFIKDGRTLRRGSYENGKFIEKEKNTIISADDKKICTKKECIYIYEKNMIPIIELADGKIQKGSWSFGPAKLKIERSIKKHEK
ncbi:MAG: hypothetical protein HXK70_04855 [Clostridiales bacterium]|nr:hypothetical protein [Clostridiales bacterium]